MALGKIQSLNLAAIEKSLRAVQASFDPSTLAKNARKHRLKMLIETPKLVRRMADQLKGAAEEAHVLP